MPIQEFALNAAGTKRVQFFQDDEERNSTILLDRVILGSISSKDELIAGREFPLTDGSILRVQLVNDQVRMMKDGQALPPLSAEAVRKADLKLAEAGAKEGNPLLRFLALPVFWGSILVIGLLIAIGGIVLIHNATSEYTSFRGVVTSIGATASSPDIQFQLELDSRIFLLNPNDFTPSPRFGLNSYIESVYRLDNGIPRVVQVTTLDSNGQSQQVFTSKEYTEYIQTNRDAGVRQGSIVLAIGLLIAVLALSIPIGRRVSGRKRQR